MQSYVNHIIRVLPQLLEGAVLTVEITSLSVFFGIIIGLFMGLGKLSKNLFFKVPATIYVDFIRGTPLFVQILLFYYGIPGLISTITESSFKVEAMVAAVVVCSINSGAYVAEIFRAGIQSIERGQMEAARSLGMTSYQAMRYIILPQAFKRIVPPLGNEFIVLLKDTSLLAVIGVQELTRKGQLYVAVTFASFPTYIGVALVYLVMTLTISRLVDWTERRLGVSDRRD
ncbi:MAG: nickel transporter [Peptococcaceae bacterium BICA1-8]|nr:MAG: nickel transporter [Peptococcaceae bacterium BICA1-8]